MHQIRHRSTARALAKASFFHIAALLSLITFLGLVAWMFVSTQYNLLIPVEISGGIMVVLGILSLVSTRNFRCRCQLCQAPIMNSKCSRDKNAKRLFGSYRLHLAVTILLIKQFRCPYCGERFNCIPAEEAEEDPNTRLRPTMSVRRMGALPTKKKI